MRGWVVARSWRGRDAGAMRCWQGRRTAGAFVALKKLNWQDVCPEMIGSTAPVRGANPIVEQRKFETQMLDK